MEGSVTTDGDYISSHVTGFPTDEDDSNQRVGGLTSTPVNNGVRYHAQQPAMQDLQYVIFYVLIRTTLPLHSSSLLTPLSLRCASSGSGQLGL